MTTGIPTAINIALLFVIVTTVTASASGQACVEPPNTTMVAWYPFDELGGTTSTDLAASNTGTQVNGPLGIAAGEVGGAASFNGTNQFVESLSSIDTNFGIVGAPFSCNGNDSSCWGNFSIDTWIQIPPTAPIGIMVIVDKRAGSPPTMQGYHFFVDGGSLGVQLADGLAPSPGYTNYYSPALLSYDNKWHHIAVTVLRTGLSPVITWYLDGASIGTSPVTRLGSLVNGNPLRIGTRTADPPLSGWFQGHLDELEIFNRQLTANEVLGIFNAQSAGKCKPTSGTALSSCVPSSSPGTLVQNSVTAYVPRGYWGGGRTGIQVVPIEPPGTPVAIATPNVVNSCAANSVTGQIVCVANNTDVYLITNSALNTTLTSGATGQARFSGGNCYNCGVAIDAVHNQAVLEVGLSGSPSNSGIQILDLAGNCLPGTPLCTPFPLQYPVSESIQIDPYRNFYLSPSEFYYPSSIYDLIINSSPGTTNQLTEYSGMIHGNPGVFDSAAEDCSTGIALASVEGTDTNSLFITDLTQILYGTGIWTAPYAFGKFPEFNNMNEGATDISVAQGSHLTIVSSECCSEIAVVVLPTTSGSGTPTFGDYVAAYLPNTPDGNPFSIGDDPHTINAYTSPNDGRAYGVVESWNISVPQPTYLAVIDLQKLLNAPRCNGNCMLGPHEVDPNYDLLANKVVTYVSAF